MQGHVRVKGVIVTWMFRVINSGAAPKNVSIPSPEAVKKRTHISQMCEISLNASSSSITL